VTMMSDFTNGTQKVLSYVFSLAQQLSETAEMLCRNSCVSYLQALLLYVVSIFYGFPPPGNKDLFSLLVEVLWGLSEPHLHFDKLVIPKLSSTTDIVH
jgi:hypothetical protein